MKVTISAPGLRLGCSFTGCPLEEDQQRRLKSLLESAPANSSYITGADSWAAQKEPSKVIRSGGLGPLSTADVIDLGSDDEDAQGSLHHLSLTEERSLKRLDRDLTDLESLDHITSALCDVSVQDHKVLVEEGDRLDVAEEVEELEEMEGQEPEEVEDPADSIPLASLFSKHKATPPPRIVPPQRRKPGLNLVCFMYSSQESFLLVLQF